MEEFAQINIFSPSIFDIAGNLLVALFCGIIIAIVYRITYRGTSYSPTFVNSLVLLCMIVAVVILVIGNNLARAFGLVGAMSIIRFRTAVRDVQDIIFIFFSLTIGMAAGVGLIGVSLLATLIIASVIMLLVFSGFGNKTGRRHLLRLMYVPGQMDDNELKKLLGKHARKLKLLNIKDVGDLVEVTYQFKIRRFKKIEPLLAELKSLASIKQSNIFYDDGFEAD